MSSSRLVEVEGATVPPTRQVASTRPARRMASDEGGEAEVMVERAVLLAVEDDGVDGRALAGSGHGRSRRRGRSGDPHAMPAMPTSAAPCPSNLRRVPLHVPLIPTPPLEKRGQTPILRGAGRAPRGSTRRSPPCRPSPAGFRPGRRRPRSSGRAESRPRPTWNFSSLMIPSYARTTLGSSYRRPASTIPSSVPVAAVSLMFQAVIRRADDARGSPRGTSSTARPTAAGRSAPRRPAPR